MSAPAPDGLDGDCPPWGDPDFCVPPPRRAGANPLPLRTLHPPHPHRGGALLPPARMNGDRPASECRQRGCAWTLPHRHPQHHLDRIDIATAALLIVSLGALLRRRPPSRRT